MSDPSENDLTGAAVIVPARLESQRFPRKLLHTFRGKPLILHTAERIRSEVPELPLFFAVAEEELEDCLETAGFRTIRTDPALPSGTDRIAHANRKIRARKIINVQADEPLVTGGQIRSLLQMLDREGVAMSTLAIPLKEAARFQDPNQVKVVRSVQGVAMYFSRAPIPWVRDEGGKPDNEKLTSLPVYGHLGLYGYRDNFLEAYLTLAPSPLEKLERLEQLRALENGYQIAVDLTNEETIGIDTPQDLERLQRHFDN